MNSNRSPGKGGKSLELMQQRLKAQQQNSPEGGSAPEPSPSPQPVVAAPAATAPVSASAPAAAAASLTVQVPAGRPKGKDFSLMSARARPPGSVSPPPPAALAATSTPSPSVVAANNAAAAAAAAATASKPKGKDFSAMASRMGPPVPVPAAPPVVAPSQPIRTTVSYAAPATGSTTLPLTASGTVNPMASTTVSSTPTAPMQQSSVLNNREAQIKAAARAAAGFSLDRSAPPVAPPNPKPTVRSAPASTSHTAKAASTARTSSSSNARRTSGGGGGKAPLLPKSQQHLDHKPSAVPSLSESRVSLQAFASSSSQQHMAPLVGVRLQSLVQSLDPTFVLDSACEQQVLTLVDDFMDKTLHLAIKLAQHRGSKSLDVADVQLILHKQWGIDIPGLGPPVLNKTTKASSSHATETTNSKKRKAGSVLGGPTKVQKDHAGQSTAPTSTATGNASSFATVATTNMEH
jgi:transcription initiation factor TFIID subunit 12